MPPINNYRCNRCDLEFPRGWGGHMVVENEEGRRIVCPHPCEQGTVDEVLLPILASAAAKLVAGAKADTPAGDAVVEYLRGLAGLPHVPREDPGSMGDRKRRSSWNPEAPDEPVALDAWRTIAEENISWDLKPRDLDPAYQRMIAELRGALEAAGVPPDLAKAVRKLAATEPGVARATLSPGGLIRKSRRLPSVVDLRKLDAIVAEYFPARAEPARRRKGRGSKGQGKPVRPPAIQRSRRDRLLAALRYGPWNPWNPTCGCLECVCVKSIRQATGARYEPTLPGRIRLPRHRTAMESALEQIVIARVGFNSFCICRDCLHQFEADLADETANEHRTHYYRLTRPKDARQCPSCRSTNVKTVFELIGQPCPKCVEGMIVEIETGIMC